MALGICLNIWIIFFVLWTVVVPVRLQEAPAEETTSSPTQEEQTSTFLAEPAQEGNYNPQETTTSSSYNVENEYQTHSSEYQTSFPSEYQTSSEYPTQGYDGEPTTMDPMQTQYESDYDENTNTQPTYTNSWPGQRTTTKKSRWSSNRNTRKNRYEPNSNKNYGNSKRYIPQSDQRFKQSSGDGILAALSRNEKWNRNGMVKSGD